LIKVEKARSNHFEEVYELLKELGGENIAKSDWKNIFIDHFNSGEKYYGYILTDNGRIKGFLGLVFSHRLINKRKIKFCNIGNWIVDPKYRNKSNNLLFPVLRLENVVLTNFTASPIVSAIFKTLKFEELDDKFYIIPPIPSLSILEYRSDFIQILNDVLAKKYLSKDDIKLFSDHSNKDFNIYHIIMRSSIGYCYIIAKKAYRNKLPFLHIYYINDIKLFLKYINIFRIMVPYKFKVISVIIDQRFLNGQIIDYTISYKLQSPRFCRAKLKKPIIDLQLIDHLYSEFVLLNI